MKLEVGFYETKGKRAQVQEKTGWSVTSRTASAAAPPPSVLLAALNGWMDGWMDGRMNEWLVGKTDAPTTWVISSQGPHKAVQFISIMEPQRIS